MSNPALKMGLRRRPYVFTEHGVAMLSSVLRSERAVQANIEIIRAFVGMRRILGSHKDLAAKLEKLEARITGHDEEIALLFQAIRGLMAPKGSKKSVLGFHSSPTE